jgi:hypothetical protein
MASLSAYRRVALTCSRVAGPVTRRIAERLGQCAAPALPGAADRRAVELPVVGALLAVGEPKRCAVGPGDDLHVHAMLLVFLRVVRPVRGLQHGMKEAHWGTEVVQHVRDTTFGEDKRTTRRSEPGMGRRTWPRCTASRSAPCVPPDTRSIAASLCEISYAPFTRPLDPVGLLWPAAPRDHQDFESALGSYQRMGVRESLQRRPHS